MLQLPNGCRCSTPSIFPKNWKQINASVSKDWRLQYYFYHPVKAPKGKLFVLKSGINKFKTAVERKHAMTMMLEDLLAELKEGFNPIDGSKSTIKNFDSNTDMSFSSALRFAFNKVKIADDTRTDIRSMMKYFEAAAAAVGVAQIPVSEIRRRHIKATLEQAQSDRKLTPQRYNKYRDYLSLLFSELVEDELIESNYIREIKKQDAVIKIREQLTMEQCIKVDQHLRNKVYNFWRFTNLFFQSGGRIVELLRVQAKDVAIDRQEYKVVINKGKKRKEVIRVINNEILPLWKELLQLSCSKEDHIFSIGLVPGPRRIRREQITRRWEVHVKQQLNITADFYSLKHLFLERAAENYDISTSQQLADHTTPVVTMKHYATGHSGRELDKKKKIKISFAG